MALSFYLPLAKMQPSPRRLTVKEQSAARIGHLLIEIKMLVW
jgi:hypothetical protein